MSKHLLELLLSDLTTLRVRCEACGLVFEVAIAEASKKLAGSACPACGTNWGIWDAHAGVTAISKLAAALRDLTDPTNRTQVSFVVEMKEDKKP